MQIIGFKDYDSSECLLDDFCDVNTYKIPYTVDKILPCDESISFDWKGILNKLENYTSFSGMANYVSSTCLPPVVPRMKYCLVDSDEIDKIAEKFWPSDGPQGYQPVETNGDGNCFFHTISRIFHNTEDHHDEVRVRITFEGVMNKDSCLRHGVLVRGLRRPSENLPRQYTLYSGELEDGLGLDNMHDENVETVYERDVVANARSGNFSGILQFYHAAQVYRRPIASIYPRRTNFTIQSHLH